MPNRIQWNTEYSVGSDVLDRQHQDILTQCNALANCIATAGQESDQTFNATFAALMAQARDHFAAEEALLAQRGYPMLVEQKNEHDEFDYLANEIITRENFEPVELQRFLTLWWTGHIMGSRNKYRNFLMESTSA
jgi:hemerythrin-like metal-binding protein